jgi:Arc/MetJ family transcription regulator
MHKIRGMRTTLDLPEGVLERARRAANLRTKSETVVAGLEELIRKGERAELRGLAGKIRMGIDLERSRQRKSRQAASSSAHRGVDRDLPR